MAIDCAVIVEPRRHPSLIPVINNILTNLSTPIHIFHGKLNQELLKVFKSEIDSKRIILTNLNIVNLTVREYSDMLVTTKFWDQISGENILIFQTDSCVCNPIDLSEYSQYGYVGAPSKLYPSTWQNGGFSLRKRSLMILACQDKKPRDNIFPEDKYFSVIKKHITNPAPYDLALKFSVEQYYYHKPFGLHKAWLYLSKDKWEQLKNDCPEINLVFPHN
jgi:hypothetical protein